MTRGEFEAWLRHCEPAQEFRRRALHECPLACALEAMRPTPIWTNWHVMPFVIYTQGGEYAHARWSFAFMRAIDEEDDAPTVTAAEALEVLKKIGARREIA